MVGRSQHILYVRRLARVQDGPTIMKVKGAHSEVDGSWLTLHMAGSSGSP